MKFLRKFNESNFPYQKSEIESICKELKIHDFVIHPDGTVDSASNVYIRENYDRIPLKFGIVGGNFAIIKSMLTSLEGCPRVVKGDVHIIDCPNLTSLEGFPEEVYGMNIDDANVSKKIAENVEKRKVNFLEGVPEKVKSFHLRSNYISSLEGMPRFVEGSMSLVCPNLWNPKELRDLYFRGEHDPSFNDSPIQELLTIFGSFKKFQDSLDFNYIRKPIKVKKSMEPWWKDDQNEFHVEFYDYDYKPSINLFRFKEALEDAEIRYEVSEPKPKKFILGTVKFYNGQHNPERQSRRLNYYVFVDDDGNLVDFNGVPTPNLTL